MFKFYLNFNILIIEIISYKLIVIPFQEIITKYNESEKNINNTSLLFLNNYLDYKTITEIKIGTPPKKIPFLINSNIKLFRARIENSLEYIDFKKYDTYIPSKSLSFKNITEFMNTEMIFSLYYSLINESVILCADKNCNNEILIKNIQMFLENLNNIQNIGKINPNYSYIYTYGELGFSTSKSTDTQGNLLNELKKLDYITSIIFTIEYSSDENGFIYIGEYPHIYNNKKFKEEFLMTGYTYPVQGFSSQLKLKLNRLYIIDENQDYIDFENNIIFFNFGLGLILSTEEYYKKIIDIFFNKYIKLNICKENKVNKGRNIYHVISCKKDQEFKIEQFPSLYLFKEEFKYIFELNYKDLFQEVNKEYYFLVVYFPFSNTNFELGKPFLKKYQITYNSDTNTLHYYNELLKKEDNRDNININNKNNLYIILIPLGIVIIIIIFIIIFLSKKLYQKRKLRPNELDDEYDYNAPTIND